MNVWSLLDISLLIYALLAVLGGVVLLYSPFVGLLGIISLIPGEELTTFVTGRTLVFILGVATAAAWFLKVLLKGEKIKVAAMPMSLILLWFLWGLASSLWAKNQTLALSRAMIIVQGGIFLILLWNLINDEKRLRLSFAVYFTAAVLFSLVAIGAGVSEGIKRVVVTETQNPNAFARALGIGLLLTPYLFDIAQQRWQKIILMLGSSSLLLAIFMTGSRGAWLGLIGAIAVTWLISRRRFIRIRSLTAMGILLAVLILTLNHYGMISKTVHFRVLTLVTSEYTIESARIRIWRVGWEMIKDNPVVGVGLQNFPVRFEDYIAAAGMTGKPGIYPGRDPHNIFLSVQAELGLPGLLLIITLFSVILGRLLPYRADKRAICGILLLLFMAFSGIVATIQYRKFFWLALGLAILIPRVIYREKTSRAHSITYVP